MPVDGVQLQEMVIQSTRLSKRYHELDINIQYGSCMITGYIGILCDIQISVFVFKSGLHDIVHVQSNCASSIIWL